MGFTVLTPDNQPFAPPSWRPYDDRQFVEIPLVANIEHSRCHLWRYPAGARQVFEQEEIAVAPAEAGAALWQGGNTEN